MLSKIRDSESAAPSSWRARRQRATLLTAAIAGAVGLVAAAGGWILTQQLPQAAPWALGAGGLGLVALLALGPRLEKLPPRATAVLAAALLGLTLASGYRVTAAVPASPTAPSRHDPNAVLVAHGLRISDELRGAYMGKEGRVPARGELVSFLRRQPNGATLLENPFGGPPPTTTRLLPAAGAPLPSAAELVAGKAPVPLGTKLGPGAPAADGRPYTLRTYGAIAFDHDAASGEYVLYVIGRQDDQAVLVHQARGPR